MVASRFRRCFSTFLEYVEECDLFAPNILLRYKNETQFKTLTSAVLSITLVVFFIVVFSSRFLQCANRENVAIETAFIEDMDPTPYSINTSEFMFVVGLEGMNMTGGKKYFDINITQWSYQDDNKSTHDIGMQPCTYEQWNSYGDEFSQRYQSLGLAQWLCPVVNQTIDLQGKFSSRTFKLMKIGVSKCTGSNCATDAEIQAHITSYKTFKVVFYYTKTVLNPESMEPTSMTLDDSVYLQFSLTLGSTSNLFFEGYTINTDYSLTPKQDIRVNSGITTYLNPEIRAYSIFDAPNVEYASIFIRKSPKSRTITRSYEKYDTFLSYIGGLFGLITIVLALPLYYYNLCCYELSLATNMFTYKKTSQEDVEVVSNEEQPGLKRKSTISKREEKEESLKHSVDRFNFIVFIGFLPYQALKVVGAFKTGCEIFQPYYEAIRQVRKQIDIGKILQKFTYYDRMSKSLLDEHQRNLLHIYSRENICEVARERSKYKFQFAANAAMQKPNPPPNTHDILKNILKQHLKPPEVDKDRVQRDIRQLSLSYKFLANREDQVSRRILENLDPDVAAMLKVQKEREQVINPMQVEDLNDVHLEIRSEINEDHFPYGGSLSQRGHEQTNDNINGAEIELPPVNLGMRKIKSMGQR